MATKITGKHLLTVGAGPKITGNVPSLRMVRELNKTTAPNPFLPTERVFLDERTGGGYGAVEVRVFPGVKDKVHLSSIRSFERGKGYGDYVLNKVTKLADKHKVKMDLTVQPFGSQTLNKKKLTEFYQKHGFEKRPGTDYMTRNPAPWLDEPRDELGRWTYK